MKALLSVLLVTLASLTLSGAFAPASAADALPASAAPPQDQMALYCSSDDMQRQFCPTDTRGGVQLLRQRSEAACIFGRSWGYDDRSIWVDRGCRAEFQAGAARWDGWGQTFTIFCASEGMERNFCPTDTHHGVRLARQRGETDCHYGRTWGYTARGIWVDHGCRADFEIGQAGWTAGGEAQTIYCVSPLLGRHYCEANTSRGVRLLRQRSDADCVYGRTWGYDERGIWVEGGCRADFQTAHGDGDEDTNDAVPEVQAIYCASDDMGRHSCWADTRGGVRLLRQRSEAQCLYGQTWGYDDRNIWVDRGCRADFQIGGASAPAPVASQPAAAVASLYCPSDDMTWHACPADTRGGVRLLRQRSEAPCTYGQTWGYDDRNIWVDRGCRADFQIDGTTTVPVPTLAAPAVPGTPLYCPSDDMKWRVCPMDTRAGVYFLRQRSEGPCVYGLTWGYDDRNVWVDRGCRADFQIGGTPPTPAPMKAPFSFYCPSDDMKWHACPVNTRGGVRLLRQRSEAPCTYGQTWGYDDRNIWVDRGCRADFQIDGTTTVPVPTLAAPAVPGTPLYCPSDDMKWRVCPMDTRAGVYFLRQRSEGPCVYGLTWGYDDRNVWVDRGCRADFQIGGTPPTPAPMKAPFSFYCPSDDMKWHACPVNTRGGVRLLRQRSEAPCTYGQTWGFDALNIWVDRGCRGDFQIGAGSEPPPRRQTVSLYCASDKKELHNCPADTTGGVRLVKVRGNKPCVQGDSWGYDSRGVWVGNGCRADFEIGRGEDPAPGGASSTLYCASDDMRRHTCPADTRNAVELFRQRSEIECFFGRTWGYDAQGIWVDGGCRAEFLLRSEWKSGGKTATLYCPSDDMGRHSCVADTRRGVRLLRQRSEAKCVYDSTWGYDSLGIWVDRGCRADFEVWRPN